MRALITGASSGIGEALSYLLYSKGISLVLSGRDEKRLKKVAEATQSEYIIADLSEKGGRQKLLENIQKTLPDYLIFNAGYAVYGEMLNISTKEHLKVLEVNATAAIELTLESSRMLLSAHKKCVILNVSSVAAEHPSPGMGLYGSAKACLTHFSRTLNAELKSRGIYVLVSSPGMVASDFANRAASKPVTMRGGPVMSPEYAAKQIWKQIEKRQEKRIFSWLYRFAVYFTPAFLVKKIVERRIKQRL